MKAYPLFMCGLGYCLQGTFCKLDDYWLRPALHLFHLVIMGNLTIPAGHKYLVYFSKCS